MAIIFYSRLLFFYLRHLIFIQGIHFLFTAFIFHSGIYFSFTAIYFSFTAFVSHPRQLIFHSRQFISHSRHSFLIHDNLFSIHGNFCSHSRLLIHTSPHSYTHSTSFTESVHYTVSSIRHSYFAHVICILVAECRCLYSQAQHATPRRPTPPMICLPPLFPPFFSPFCPSPRRVPPSSSLIHKLN